MSSLAGREARDEGIQRAADGAETRIPGWGDRALDILACFASRSEARTQPFTSEDVRKYAANLGLPSPPELRAWGSVFQRAVRRGMIRRAGTGTAAAGQAHCRLQALWVAGGGAAPDPVRDALVRLLELAPAAAVAECQCKACSNIWDAVAQAHAALGR